MIEETLKKRFFQELEDHHHEALARAVTIVRKMNWQPGSNSVSRREKAEQLLHDAMLLVLDGSRRWNSDHVDVVPFLGQIVRSLLSHEMESTKGRTRSLDAWRADQAASPEDVVLSHEHEQQRAEGLNRAIKAVFVAAGDDLHIRAVLEAMLEGECAKPREVAAYTGMAIDDVYEALRRLRRRVERGRNAGTPPARGDTRAAAETAEAKA